MVHRGERMGEEVVIHITVPVPQGIMAQAEAELPMWPSARTRWGIRRQGPMQTGPLTMQTGRTSCSLQGEEAVGAFLVQLIRGTPIPPKTIPLAHMTAVTAEATGAGTVRAVCWAAGRSPRVPQKIPILVKAQAITVHIRLIPAAGEAGLGEITAWMETPGQAAPGMWAACRPLHWIRSTTGQSAKQAKMKGTDIPISAM